MIVGHCATHTDISEVNALSTINDSARTVARVPLSRIHTDPNRPRGDFPEESIRRLAESIRLHGLLSPLLLRECGGGDFQLVSGERRLRALALLNRGWAEAIVLTTGSPCDCALIALVENLQREQLHYLDVAAACRRILDRYPITQERLAASLSCSPSALANRLRLLRLPPAVQRTARDLGLSERHARALLRLQSEADQLALAELAAQKRMSAAQLDKRIDERLSPPPALRSKPVPLLRDSRVVVNALLDTVRRLTHIGIPVQSRVEEGDGCVNVIVTIPAVGESGARRA